MFFVLAAVSLPVPPLKADALTLPNRFFLSSLDLCGFRHTCACELASIAGMPDPLISSFISARGLPGKGCSAARMGAEGGWDVPSNTSLLCQIGSSGVLLKSTRGNSLSSPSPRLAPIPLLGSPSGQGFASPLRALDRASLRSSGALRRWLRGNDNSRGFIQVQNNFISVIDFG